MGWKFQNREAAGSKKAKKSLSRPTLPPFVHPSPIHCISFRNYPQSTYCRSLLVEFQKPLSLIIVYDHLQSTNQPIKAEWKTPLNLFFCAVVGFSLSCTQHNRNLMTNLAIWYGCTCGKQVRETMYFSRKIMTQPLSSIHPSPSGYAWEILCTHKNKLNSVAMFSSNLTHFFKTPQGGLSLTFFFPSDWLHNDSRFSKSIYISLPIPQMCNQTLLNLKRTAVQLLTQSVNFTLPISNCLTATSLKSQHTNEWRPDTLSLLHFIQWSLFDLHYETHSLAHVCSMTFAPDKHLYAPLSTISFHHFSRPSTHTDTSCTNTQTGRHKT